MAIPLKSLRETLGPVLDRAFEAVKDHGWAVFYECNQNDMTYRITKVEPWDYWEHSVDGPGARRHSKPGIIRIEKAPDELGAYVEAMRRLEGASDAD